MKNSIKRIAGIGALILALSPGIASAQTEEDWEYSFALYFWGADISGTTAFGLGGGNDFTVPLSDILDSLEFAMMGAFNARKGKWGLMTDLIYMDLENGKNLTRGGNIGDTPITGELGVDLTVGIKSTVLTGAATYRFHENDTSDADFLFGARWLDMEQTLDYSISGDIGPLPIEGPSGSLEASGDNLDFLIGLRGNTRFGEGNRWFIPYYIDMGMGDSDFTWQAFAGIGYGFSWGEMALTYRVIDYDFDSDTPFSSIDFSGPSLGARWTW